jgi:hypothetical protein
MKLALLLAPVPMAALILMPVPADPGPDGLTTEERACSTAGTRLGHETVRVPWTLIRTLDGEIDVMFCVLRGDSDAQLEFARDAERVQFTFIGRGTEPANGTYSFVVRTSEDRTIELGPAAVLVQPRNRHSCRVEICQAFTDPGERVKSVLVRTH